jgi:hypothetical protein
MLVTFSNKNIKINMIKNKMLNVIFSAMNKKKIILIISDIRTPTKVAPENLEKKIEKNGLIGFVK